MIGKVLLNYDINCILKLTLKCCIINWRVHIFFVFIVLINSYFKQYLVLSVKCFLVNQYALWNYFFLITLLFIITLGLKF